jgi:hypothetical protein
MEAIVSDAWVTLIAAVSGGLIALSGQYLVHRDEDRKRRAAQILELCATMVALSEDFLNRLWEERNLGHTGRVDSWDLPASRLTEAKLRILVDDPQLLSALDEVQLSGKVLGASWRRGQIDDKEVEGRYREHRAAITHFFTVSRRLLR